MLMMSVEFFFYSSAADREKALAPYICEEIMRLHHDKHHATYVNNLNAALSFQQTAASSSNIVDQINLQSAIRFNAGGHINHTLFWENLAPKSSSSVAELERFKLTNALKQRWGSLETFKQKFEAVLLAIQGSGWGWLVQDEEDGHLELVTTKDQDIVPKGKKPILGIDMWEHAYYIQYKNNKKDYVNGIWNVVNWSVVENRFLADTDKVFGSLKGLKATL